MYGDLMKSNNVVFAQDWYNSLSWQHLKFFWYKGSGISLNDLVCFTQVSSVPQVLLGAQQPHSIIIANSKLSLYVPKSKIIQGKNHITSLWFGPRALYLLNIKKYADTPHMVWDLNDSDREPNYRITHVRAPTPTEEPNQSKNQGVKKRMKGIL